MKVCAVVPAAGRGSRLNADTPKILLPIVPGKTVWDILRDKFSGLVDHVHLVLSPAGERSFLAHRSEDLRGGFVTLSIQREPTGMGDAIFGCESFWTEYDTLLVVWGDQVHVSSATLRRCLERHGGQIDSIVLPLVERRNPYVQYIFDAAGRLSAIRQSREGDACDPEGLSDVGTFVLSVKGLGDEWRRYAHRARPGHLTKELNFLPFLAQLSATGWSVRRHVVSDADEARGINTTEDLDYFRAMYSRG